MELNNLSNLEVINAVVGEIDGGYVSFNSTLNGQVNNKDDTDKYPSLSIDGLMNRFGIPDILYIDIEGYACNALRGAINTLKKGPDCFVEVHVNHGLEEFGSVNELFEIF